MNLSFLKKLNLHVFMLQLSACMNCTSMVTGLEKHYLLPVGQRIKQEGSNILEIVVTNTIAKKIHDVFSRAMAQEPFALLGPV